MEGDGPKLGQRVLRRIEQLLDEADEAVGRKDWSGVRENARAVLALDPGNTDAETYLAAAERALAQVTGDRGQGTEVGDQGIGDRDQGTAAGEASPGPLLLGEGRQGRQPGGGRDVAFPDRLQAQPGAGPRTGEGAPDQPRSFVNGRYQVQRFLGEGGKKRVYLARDTRLDRDVAFALLKTEGLDAEGMVRIRREAQAMARLGDHPHIVTVYDIGEENGQPYLVCQYMAGGDLAHLLAEADNHRFDWEPALQVADQVCQALEHAHKQGIVHRDIKPGNVWLTEGPGDRGQGTEPGSGPGLLAPNPQPLSPATTAVVAKLGDFGLALTMDRSRLTQAGMMVGTVAYMAPEQALGSEVTARSDLYSLGALLYELVTGRPPFVGDDSVAIITQHLNTPPVAPSWHRLGLPPGLEALILRLLEKDPAKRPASASEVRQMLASVSAPTPTAPPFPPPAGSDLSGEGQGTRSSPPSVLGEGPGEGAVSPAPLYRSVFVGREAELRQLQTTFDAALSGRGALAMVVGEPGIGKTALCEQMATYVAVRGGKTLVGHCYEEGSLSLPYLAFVEALRSYVLGQAPDRLKAELGSGAAEVARIVSEIRDRVEVELRPAGDPEDDRWRLFQAVTGFLRNAAAVQPLVVVLEDLHWADRGTLDLLTHVARNLEQARLLIVGTYRDVEVDRAHPLSATLAELRRVGQFARIPLRGLTVDEVSRMMNIIRGQEVPWSRAEAIHRQTEGNPLFVQEVLRYLVEEGLVVREGGHYVRTDGGEPDSGIPEGLRDVVGKRLSRLSEKTNQVLSVAAVMGREFRLDVLQQVAGFPDEEIDASLQEAMERAILEERSGLGVLGFRFTHAFFRQTLYEEIFASRRLRLHQQVARALEGLYSPGGRRGGEQGDPVARPAARTAGRLEEHASELAEHFAQSTDPADLEKALSYSELAAKRGLGVFAYGEAARHLEMALKIQEVLDPDDQAKRCDLLLALGEAMLPMEEPRRVADTVAEEAFALAEALDDSPRAAKAAVQALEALLRRGEGPTGAGPAASPEFQEWARRGDQRAQPGTIQRTYAELYLGLARMQAAGPAAGHVHLRRAADLALELDDSAAFFAAASWAVARLNALQDYGLKGRVAAEALRRPREGARTRDLGIVLLGSAEAVFDRGDREAAEETWRELARLAERTQDATLDIQAMGYRAMLAFVDGRLEEARAQIASVHARAQLLAVSGVQGGTERIFDARVRYYLGQPVEPLLATVTDPQRYSQAQRAVVLSWLGQGHEVRTIRERFGAVGADEDESAIHILIELLEASLGIGDAETTQALLGRLAPLAGHLRLNVGVSVGRLLGDGARLLGRPDEARGYYAQALEVCEKIRFRPEIALIRLAQAELALSDQPSAISDQPGATSDEPEKLQPGALAVESSRREALKQLDFAIAEFEAMKMQPSLERALALKKSLSG